MLVTVLKAFPYSANGIVTLHLAPSDKDPPEPVEIRDDLVTGLVAEGFIALEGVAYVQSTQTETAPAADGAQAGAAEVVPADAEPAVAPVAAPVVIPADWQAAHWKTRVALAKAIDTTVGDIKNEEAIAIIEAELKNRALDAPQEDAGGLTIRELHADIAGLGLDVDPTMGPADLLALRDLHREERAKLDGE